MKQLPAFLRTCYDNLLKNFIKVTLCFSKANRGKKRLALFLKYRIIRYKPEYQADPSFQREYLEKTENLENKC